jgi:hypothetical protein
MNSQYSVLQVAWVSMAALLVIAAWLASDWLYERLRRRYPAVWASLGDRGDPPGGRGRGSVGKFIWSPSYRTLRDPAISACILFCRVAAIIVGTMFVAGLVISFVEKR